MLRRVAILASVLAMAFSVVGLGPTDPTPANAAGNCVDNYFVGSYDSSHGVRAKCTNGSSGSVRVSVECNWGYWPYHGTAWGNWASGGAYSNAHCGAGYVDPGTTILYFRS